MEENYDTLLQKGTAKQIILSNGGLLKCPTCGRNLPSQRRYKYCPECGQKLGYDGDEYIKKWDIRYNRPRILFDMDDCINSFLNYLLSVYNERTGAHIKPSEIKDWDLEKYVGEYGISIFKEEGFFEGIPEKKNATRTLKKLIMSADYDVYVITACTTNHELEEKYKWFDKYLPEFNKDRIIKCKEKEIIHGDVLIDDKIENLVKCSPYMRCVLFDMPHNRGCNDFPRIKSLSEVIPLLKEWFY